VTSVPRAVRALPRDARLLLLSSFLGSLPIGLLLVFFPLYLHDLGLRTLLIGGIFTAAGVGSSILLLAIGPLADRFGRRPFLIAGTALPALGFAIFALTTNVAWLVVASLLGGVGFSGGLGGGLITATFNPMLAGTVEPHRRTTVMSWGEGVWTASMACGSLLATVPALIVRARFAPALAADRALFMGCLLLTLCAALALVPVRDRSAFATAGVPTADATRPPRAPVEWTLLVKLAVFFTLQGAGLGLVVQLLPLWFALRFGAATPTIAPWFAVSQIAGLAVIPFVPSLARRLGVGGVVLLAIGASTLLLVGVPFAPVLPVAGLFYVLRSALVSMQWPAQLSFLQGAVDPRMRGLATSVALSCWSIAMAVLPTLAGYFMDRRLLQWPLVLGIGCYTAAAVWFYLTLRRTPLPEEAVGAMTVGSEVEPERLVVMPERAS
jgi:MFS family permease